MLHLKFALNLEHLADEMIEAISVNWTSPFEAPVVIFPDPKLEQWFRLRWMKKKGVLANLNKSTIDRFLFDILVGNDESRQKLSADILRNVILAYLVQESNGIPNYKALDAEVTRYLMVDGNPDGKLDENHLFDFASKMSSLFLEYEASRPSEFTRSSGGSVAGILDQWKQGHLQPFFANYNKSLAARENWQQKLYSAIFHEHGADSLLTQAFKNKSESTHEKKDYLTVPYLFNNRKGGLFIEEKLPHGQDGKVLPVFIFGLSGMGQFYRVILQEYAKDHAVYAYIQNPCMEFWEDARKDSRNFCRNWNVSKDGEWQSTSGDIGHIRDIMKVLDAENTDRENPITDIEDIPEENDGLEQENELLASWGRSGRDNIKLWCQATDYDFDFKGLFDKDGNEIVLPQDTLLHKVQYSIAHRENKLELDNTSLNDGSLDVTSAPTKIREIENLHTQICKLLQKGARVEDILVVSPNLDDYRTAINMVFDQSPAKLEPGSDKNGYLHIPFAIVDSPARNSLTENALSNLFAILTNGSITRPDFFALVRNPVVQCARGISNDDVEAWQNWIAETNTFRNRNEKNDWETVKNRLLMAQMTSSDVDFAGDTLRPFSDMACSNKKMLCNFIDCIEALEEWIEYGKNPCSELDKLSEQLDKWIAMPKVPDSLKSESIVYRRVTDAISLLGWQNAAGTNEISMKIVEQSLMLAAQGTEYSCGNLFVNGVTFMKFAPNRIIPVKHLFFIGADAATFPGAKQHNTLDLRKSCRPWPSDDSPILKNRYAFLCQLMSTSEGFHLSYMNKDIKKDAELYPSSVVNDLRKFIGTEWKENGIPLDETRNYSELFTLKSIRNKNAYNKMMDESSSSKNSNSSTSNKRNSTSSVLPKKPERVTVSQLSNFLLDPFQFYVGLMLQKEDEEDLEKESFEPVNFNNLDSSCILKEMLAEKLSSGSPNSEDMDVIKERLKLTGKMPNDIFEKKQWETLELQRDKVLESMANIVDEIKSNWSYGERMKDLPFESNGMRWTLTGNLDWSNAKDLKDISEIIEVVNQKSPRSNRWLSAYVKALALISLKEGSEEKTIKVKFYSVDASLEAKDPKKVKPRAANVTETPQNAKKKLESIYSLAFIGENEQPFNMAVPYDLLGEFEITDDDLPHNEKNLIYEYKQKLINGPWANFDKKNLFDPLKDVGFTAETFLKKWKKAVMKMKKITPESKPAAK